MADKTINVSLDFTANTSQAESALKNLQTSLQQITTMSPLGTQDGVLAKDITKASEAAIQLRTHLQEAMNTNTGKLDLSKFSASLKASGQDIDYYRRTLSAIGPQGQQAFRDLATSIINSETPLKQSIGLVDKLWDGLKRTVGWQLSSSMIHGFMGAIQSAYGYAQDLNKSLNNIRIVTGYSTDEMAKFAEQANKAAKGLSATTTDYTDAALIYYQQGIRDQSEIEDRVATTIKLANVSGQSAEEVSSQMTAIWNNFDDGSKSLEYYADVITALGAATASSSQEISQGLSKFAAVAETVGMSYEYATSALATIVATTRQSADTVGTGLRTLFSRLQGLKLGETLEDGVDLNKYSKALEVVGVKALDASGELRNMDEILNDLGERWGDLSQAQKVALAQTVGGVRQYTNLVALMDNWDFMKENVGIAEGAEGTLQEQADIYAESWEAAQKRVRTATEALYNDLLNDEFFISLTDGFGKVLEFLDQFIDGIGGVKTVLPGLIILMNKLFGEKIQAGVSQIAYNITGLIPKVKKARETADTEFKKATIASLEKMNQQNITGAVGSQESNNMANVYKQITAIQSEMIQKADTLTEKERQIYNLQLEVLGARAEEAGQIGKTIDQIKERIALEQKSVSEGGVPKKVAAVANYKKFQVKQVQQPDGTTKTEDPAANIKAVDEILANPSGGVSIAAQYLQTLNADLDVTKMSVRDVINAIQQIQTAGDFSTGLAEYTQLSETFAKAEIEIKNFSNATSEIMSKLESGGSSITLTKEELEQLKTALNDIDTSNFNDDQKAMVETAKKAAENFNGEQKEAEELKKALEDVAHAQEKVRDTADTNKKNKRKQIENQAENVSPQKKSTASKAMDNIDAQNEELIKKQQEGEDLLNTESPAPQAPDPTSYEKFASTLTNITTVAMQAQMAISTFSNALDVLRNPDSSGLEIILALLSSIGMGLPAVMSAFSGLTNIFKSFNAVQTITGTVTNLVSKGLVTEANASKLNLTTIAQLLISKKGVTAETIAETLGIEANTAATELDTIATEANKLAKLGLIAVIGLLVVGTIALVAHLVKVSDETYKAEQALAKSKETAKGLTDVYNETKKAYEDLKTSLTDYNDAVKGLEKLEEKSLEWKNAVSQINSEVIDLLEKYPKLAKYVDNVNGVLTISQEGQQELLKEQQQAMVKANVSRLQALQQVKRDENRVAIENARDTINNDTVSSDISVDDFAEIVKSINDSNGANLDNISAIEGVNGNADLISALDNNKTTLTDLNDTLNTNNSTIEALDTQIVNEIQSTSNLNTTIQKWAGIDPEKDETTKNAYRSEQQRVEQDLMGGITPEDMWGNFLGGFGTVEFDTIAELYQQNIDANFKKLNVTGDGTVKYQYTAENGDIKEAEMTIEEMWTRVRDSLMDMDRVTAQVDKATQESFAQNNPRLDQLLTNMAVVAKENFSTDGIVTYDAEVDMAKRDTLGEVLGQNDIDWSDTEGAIARISQDLALIGVEANPQLLANYANEMHRINEAAADEGTAQITAAVQEQQTKGNALEFAENTYEAHPSELNEKALQAARTNYLEAAHALEDAIEADVDSEIKTLDLDTEAIADMTEYIEENADEMKGVNKNITESKGAVKELAKEIVRADRAYESINDNMDDWQKTIKSTNRNAQDMARVTKQLRTAYSDLLDLDPDILSEGFLESAENLDLLQQAANGSEEAYNQLMQNAQQDIEVGLHLDSNGEFQAAKDNVMSQLDEMRNLDPIEMEAALNDEGFLNSLTEMVNAAGMTADQATAYLQTMGINAVITEAEAKTEPVQTTETDWVPATYTTRSLKTGGEDESSGNFEELVQTSPGHWARHTTTSQVMTSPGGGALKIERATAAAGGNVKYQNASHGSGSSGKKGGGGGGGGGGGSKKTKEAPQADRGTRYHNVTRRQSNNSRRQTENNRKKDRAFGKAQVELAREDLEIQKKKIELQEEYTKEISKNLKDDREEMKKQFEALKLPINFKFDEDGEIENYQEIIDALFEKEKALVEQYNSGGLDDEAFDEAKKKLDEAKEALGNYEETLELQKDELQTLAEYMEELSDKALELTQIKFELNMSIIEDQLEWLDYSLGKLENDAYGAAKAIGLMGQQTAQYLKQSEIAQNAINEILGRHGIDSIEQLNGLTDSQIEALGFNKDEIEALKDYRSKLYESNQALLEMRRTITDRVIDTFDTFNEKVQESYEEFDKYNDILEKYNDIVDLLGIKTDSATKRLIKTLRETQLQNLRNQSTSAKEIYEGAVANYDLAKKQYEDAVTRYGATSIQAQQAEEIMKNAQEAMEEGYSNWLDAYQAALEKANEIYEEAMEEIAKDFEASLTNIYGTFDLFDAAYERAKELKDDYLPEYEKIYELNKLNRDIQKEIDNSSSLRDRKALRQLQEEINRKQEAGVQLSKYEVEEMRKKFELEQARMNLEDARNNKSEVRLTRDQNGNWGYVYTAAEDKVADAEQKYEDALYNYQKLSDDYINELDEKIKDLTRNTQERLNEVSEALKDGLITADQAALQRQEILNTFYTQQNYLISQFKGATDSLSSSLGLMNDLYGRQAELVDTFPETVFGQVSGAGSLEEWANKSTSAVIKYAEEGAQAYSVLQATNQKIAEENKMALSDIETATNNIAKASEVAQEKVTSAIKALTDNFGSALGALQTWDETYGKTIANAIGKNDLFIDSLNNVIGKLATIASYEMKDLYDYIDYLSAKGAKGETITEAEWKKLDEIRQKYAANYSKESMAPFDTGGYTGEWGDEGKIAILHEKEYVLNADLTARFFDALKTFSLVDQFVNTENQIQQQQLQIETLEALSNYIDQLADRMNTTTINPNDFSASLFNSGNQQLEQNVHIEASFPNVTQSSEIEMAFDNLVNKASQYINRKNMSSMTFQDSYLSPV